MTYNNEICSDKISKTQKKREMHALQELGEVLVRLNAEQLAKVPIPDELREAIMAARSMHKHGARYRQMQYIGKLMRDVDSAPIQDALDLLRNKDNRALAQFHHLEKWREQIIAGNKQALDEVLGSYPHADCQHLMQLARNAQKEQEKGKPQKAARELFKYLRKVQEEGKK